MNCQHQYSNKQGRFFLTRKVNRTFIECSTSGTIHTEDCPITKRILLTNQRSCKDIPKNSRYCSFCKKKLFILSTAVEKAPPVDKYIDRFSRCEFSKEYLEQFLSLKCTRMLLFDARTIMFYVKMIFGRFIATRPEP